MAKDANKYLISKIRQVWGWSNGKRKARAASLVRRTSVGRNRWIEYHRCDECKGEFHRRKTHVDHVSPVVPVGKKGPVLIEPGYAKGFDVYISRLFCAPENLRVLCVTCHRLKTGKEQKERRKRKVTTT